METISGTYGAYLGSIIGMSENGEKVLFRNESGEVSLQVNGISKSIGPWDFVDNYTSSVHMSQDGSIVSGTIGNQLAVWQNGVTSFVSSQPVYGGTNKMSLDGSTVTWKEIDLVTRSTKDFIMRHGVVRETDFETISISNDGTKLLSRKKSTGKLYIQTLSR
jgi:hypothetical protein